LRTKSEYHDGPHGISIMVSAVGPRKSPKDRPKLIRPIFRYRLPTGEVTTISAREATIRFNLEEQEVELNLMEAEMLMPSGDYMKFEQEKRSFPLPAPTDSLKAPRNMTIAGIRREIQTLTRERKVLQEKQLVGTVLSLSTGQFQQLTASDPGAWERQEAERRERQNKLRTEIHSRIALSCSCMFFVLLGSPFSILYGRRQFLTNFAICFAPILGGYYPLILVFMNLCRGGIVNPIWGMWVANVALLGVALTVLRKVLRH
jgi:lipopolysaccharide export system permease protein